MYPGRMRNMRAYERSNLNSGQVFVSRTRVPAAGVNSGQVLFGAGATGLKYRLNDVALIAIGGAAGGATTVDILGVVNGATVKLMTTAVANLTQSALVRAGGAGTTILADGASFAALDQSTGISIGKTGGNLTGATNIDVIISVSIVDPTGT